MGKSPKKTTTKDSNSTSNTDYTAQTDASQTGQQRVDVPDWLLNPAQKQASAIGGIMDQGPGAFTPQLSDLTKQAAQGIGGLDTSGKAYDDARAAYGAIGDVGDMKASSLLEGLEGYYNPFKDQITNPVLNDFDVNSGKVRAAQAATGARGAFGGSRFGIREGETEGNLARGRAATEGGLLNQMYDTSTRLSGEDAGRRQSAAAANQQAAISNQSAAMQKAQQLASLAQASGADTRANLGMQAQFGGQMGDFENAQRQYPIEFAGQTGGLLAGMNPGQYFGQSSEGTSASNTTGNQSTVGTEHSKEVVKDNPGLLSNIGSVMNLAKSGMGIFGALSGNPMLMAAGKA